MKLIKIDEQTLKAKNTQNFIRILGLVMILMGVLSFLYLQMTYEITCQKKSQNYAGNCSLERRISFIYEKVIPLGVLKEAYVETRVNTGRGDKLAYTVNLMTDNGIVNLTGSQSSGREEKDSAAQNINNYIKDGVITRYQVPYDTSVWAWLFVTMFSVGGLLMVLLATDSILVFNKTNKDVSFVRKSLISRREKKLSFDDIENVIVDEKLNFKKEKTTRLAFLKKDKTIEPFTPFSYSVSKHETNAKELNEFMSKT